MASDLVGANEEPAAVGDDMKGLVAHLERLERRQDLHRDLAKAALKEEVARAVQSIGAVVDYLTARGLIDTADLKRHLQTSLLLTDGNDEGGRRTRCLDVYGWLTWAEEQRDLHLMPPLPNAIAPARSSGSGSELVDVPAYAELEMDAGRNGNVDLDPAQG